MRASTGGRRQTRVNPSVRRNLSKKATRHRDTKRGPANGYPAIDDAVQSGPVCSRIVNDRDVVPCFRLIAPNASSKAPNHRRRMI
jgi:hypothetical protein